MKISVAAVNICFELLHIKSYTDLSNLMYVVLSISFLNLQVLWVWNFYNPIWATLSYMQTWALDKQVFEYEISEAALRFVDRPKGRQWDGDRHGRYLRDPGA